MQDPLDAALDLMRRLPPQHTEQNLKKLFELTKDVENAQDFEQDVLAAVDQPLKVGKCSSTGKEFLLCDYNRDFADDGTESYRSPWSNEYQPSLPSGTFPSSKLRSLEQAINDAFETYKQMYYDQGGNVDEEGSGGTSISSVYLWDLEQDGSFAAAILIKKTQESGSWDSIHIVEVHENKTSKPRSAHYKLTSTVLLHLTPPKGSKLELDLSGSLTRQLEQDAVMDTSGGAGEIGAHIENIGKLVEEMEGRLRSSLQEVYFGKSRDIVNDLRSIVSLGEVDKQKKLQDEIRGKLQARNSMSSK